MSNNIEKNNFLNYLATVFVVAYSIALVIFVNDPIYTYIENYFAYGVLSVFVIYFFLYKKIYIPKVYVAFTAFLLLSFFVLILYPNDESYDLLYSLIQIFFFSIILYNILIFTKTSLSIEIGLILGLLYSIFIGYYFGRDFFTGFDTARYAGTLANPNHFSFMITVALLLLTRRFFLLPKFSKTGLSFFGNFIKVLMLALMLIICNEVIFYSMSRQGILIVVLIMGYLFYQVFNESQFFGKIITLCLFIFLAVNVYDVIKTDYSLYSRIGSLFRLLNLNNEFSLDASLIGRTKYISDAFNLWYQNPFFGVGLHQFKFINQSGVTHNNFLEILVNNGIVGFIFYYTLYFYFFKSYFRIKRYSKIDSNWLLTVLFMLVIADMTVLTYMEKPTWLIFTVVLFVINFYKKDVNFIIKF